MTKKKCNRPKHQKDVPLGDTSEEEFNTVNIQGKSCSHVTRGIHFGRVKKSVKSAQSIISCNGCTNQDSSLEELPEVWLCLQCGYRGCSRISENKHALQHFKTLHSDCHSLVLSTSSGSVWCYDCDDEISLQSSHALKQCVEFVMRMVPDATKKFNSPNLDQSVVNQQNLQTPTIKEEPSTLNCKENNPVEKNKLLKSNKESFQKIPIKGLRNLGNTCFFNAVMQNLNQTSLLYFELKRTCTPTHLWEVPELVFSKNEVSESDNIMSLKLSLPRQFPLTNSLLNFLEQINEGSSAKVQVVNPSPLFGEISRKCPQFRHFQQQDSHELLRQLLDGVRQEEIKRQKKAILRHFDLENVSPENVDDETKKQIKAYGVYASHTIVEKVFGGLLISTVLCEECKVSSQVFEPFMDLSLPLFEEKPLRNKKADYDSDENTAGEYVLSKSKNDPEKPSKHQEKKQKQLAKKEKKKAKNNAKNFKNPINEQCDILPESQPNESKESMDEKKDDQDSEKETHADPDSEKETHADPDSEKETHVDPDSEKETHVDPDSEREIPIDHEDEEVWEVKDLFGSDEQISKDDNKNVESTLEQNLIIEHNSDNSNIESKKMDGVSEFSQSDEHDGNSVSFTLASGGTVTPECSLKVEVKNEEDSAELQTKMAPVSPKQTCDEDLCAENLNEVIDVAAQENIQNLEKESNIESKCEETVENLQGVTLEFENSGDHGPDAENISDNVLNEDILLRTTTENFNNCVSITDSNQLDIDDRIQTLSLQIKDVRIRRDSDKQENLLNSSESADECESLKTNCTSPKSSIEDSGSLDNWSHSISEQQTKDWISKTLTTLKPRHHVSPLECSVNSCLSHFTKPELLTGNNKFRCENCTDMKIKRTGNKKDVVYSNASKQLLIFSPPAVLTLHLKRFQQVGMSLRKVNRFVEFPLILDLAPFCCSACSVLPHMSSVEDEILYSLYGVVEHSGRLTSGHYTAYVKANKRDVTGTFECQLPLAQCNLEQLLRKFSGVKKDPIQSMNEKITENSQWFYISDSHVKEVSETQVLNCQAYILFYERIK